MATVEPNRPVGPPNPGKGLPTWQALGIGVLAVFAICIFGGVFISIIDQKSPPSVSIAPIIGASEPIEAPVTVRAAPITVTGKGNVVVEIGAILNGAFRVDYSFGSWCGIVDFLRADGSDGTGFLEGVNDCSGDSNSNLTGSTIVHLSNVTLVQVDNTRDAWSLTFTPLG